MKLETGTDSSTELHTCTEPSIDFNGDGDGDGEYFGMEMVGNNEPDMGIQTAIHTDKYMDIRKIWRERL